ncbi:BRO family protein [Nostoc sp. UHCC 0252]|uniref:BRO family protein n=1 Tax=Nostoc sp. UHCC 0252 TaxID=3110241 RepID=UPI002B208534|nr:BRO family protein [Nostoc sp. UHCC 0252]MEA5603801.1 BRO family protein [Nostoc sp. UHCC 0252]
MISNLISHQTNHNSSPFNTIRHLDDNGNEHWLARELMALLGYKKWERFVDAIDRAKIGCQNTGVSVQNHFTDAGLYTRDVPSDYRLSRYACYLVAMNGDPRKPEIAAAQSYFAVKTHEAETRSYYQEKSTVAHEAAQLALLVGEFAGLEKSLTAQLAVNAATKVNPALKPAADELKSAIAITNLSDDAYLKPTDIGEKVGMSAVAVNNWLVHAGLQYRTLDKKIPYRPTDSGKQWGRMVSAMAKGSNQTVFQLRWLPTITQLFNERN